MNLSQCFSACTATESENSMQNQKFSDDTSESNRIKEVVNLPVKVIDNFAPEDLLEQTFLFVRSQSYTYGWITSQGLGHAIWSSEFGKLPKRNRDCIEDRIPQQCLRMWKHIQRLYLQETPVLIRCYVNSHVYGAEGYPHIDSTEDKDVTAVVYLNKEWRREWAGETVYFDASRWHVARSVSRTCPIERVALVFKARPSHDVPPQRNRFNHDKDMREKNRLSHPYLSPPCVQFPPQSTDLSAVDRVDRQAAMDRY